MATAAPRPGIDPALLRGAELFSNILEEDLAYAASRSSVFALKKGGRLFSVGDRASRFFIVRSGSIRVFRPRADGGTDDMAIFTAGDALGDFDFARRSNFDASAEALEDSTLFCFPGLKLTMDDLALERPNSTARILVRSLAMIAGRLRSTQTLISENSPWVRELRRRSLEDPGTGLWNRAFLDEEIARSLEAPFALIMLKPDRFKILVDSRGHAAGDEAMVRIAAVLKSVVRHLGRGWAIRIKSNELAVAVPKCTADEARTVAQQLIDGIAALEDVPACPDIPAFTFTASAGYAVWPEDRCDWASLFQSGYDALMEVWKSGGCRVSRVVPVQEAVSP